MVNFRNVLIATACIVLLGACAPSSPKDTLKAFYGHVDKGEVSEAVKLVDPSVALGLGPEKVRIAVTYSVKKVASKGGLASLELQEESVDGTRAVVSKVVTYKNGESSRGREYLVKVDGKWLVTDK
jgi:hypothetical protein